MKKVIAAFALVLVAAGAYAQSGVLKEMVGQVELKSPGSASFVAARAGDLIGEDTVVSTGFKSTAIIEVGSALLTVRPLTRLTLTEIYASSGAESVTVDLQAGRVKIDVKPPAGTKASFSVSSPISVASVRGTSFEFDVRNLYVYEGNVLYKGLRSEGTLITAGYGIGISEKGNVVNPIAYGVDSYRPRMPEGIGANTGAVTIPTGSAPSNPGSSGSPGSSGNPGSPGSPGSDDYTDVDAQFQ